MAADATLILLETLVLGRAAMGETVRRLHLRDRRRVTRTGGRVMIEGVGSTTRTSRGAGAAGLDGAIAVAALTLLSPDAADRLARAPRRPARRTARCAPPRRPGTGG
jgi:urease accessory protein